MVLTRRSVSPVLARLQLRPPSVLLNTPPSVPAYSVPGADGSGASAETSGLMSPLLAMAHVAPSSVLLKTPLDSVPAYSVPAVAGSATSALTSAPLGPRLDHTLTPACAV